MLTCASIKIPTHVNQRRKTWKFAAEFLWKKNFVKNQTELGAWTRDQLIDLGPTFVKLGQIVSTRADLYPVEFTRELESLQDNVPPIDVGCVKDVVNANNVFSEFEYDPFKSASIGQVHRATLLDGREVVVKIKRPDIYDIMKRDTDNIIDVVNFLEKIGIDTGATSGKVLEESIEYLLSESDYEKEMYNAGRMRRAFKGVKWIKIPKVYEDVSTNDMIVMEYVESQKLTELTDPDVNTKKICEALITSYVIQTMDKGLFHADPHPGNLGFSDKGKLVFYDFGLVIDITDELKLGFQDLFKCIINRDTKGIVDTLIRLNIIVPTTSDTSDIEIFFKTTLNYLETLDVNAFKNDILEDEILLSLAQKKPFTIPTSFVYLAKAFSTVEGTCIQLDENFNYYEYLEPMIREQFVDSFDIQDMFSTSFEMPSRIRNISTAVLGLEESRASMKRSLEKTRKEMRYAQYSVLSAVFAGNMVDHLPAFVLLSALSVWFAFTSYKSR
jgi:predicted unusual protein kinase regulating ubiquinone biosynthesis (AarF/ABC1/UbiB family)